MSRSVNSRPFYCLNDCRREGCPGHLATLEHHHTSDTVTILIDDERRATFDARGWDAVLKAQAVYDQSLRDRVTIAKPKSEFSAAAAAAIDHAYEVHACQRTFKADGSKPDDGTENW